MSRAAGPGCTGLWRALCAGLLLTAASGAGFAALPTAVDGEALPTLAPMIERVTPAVVNISTRAKVVVRENSLLNDPIFRRFFDLPERYREREAQSLGSGVIVDAERGYVLTNHHVVDGADQITVRLRDGRKLNAVLVGADPDTDVAVVRVPAEGLVELPLADSSALRVGDFVVAIGNPFGLGQTVTSGIVSALGRSGLGIEGYENFIQTDASINPGNSGGALVNLRGELVGINTAIIAPGGGNVGIGFAIPSSMARDIMEQLVTHGEVRRGQLGVSAQDLTPELAVAFGIQDTEGAVVLQVAEGSPAERAGLQRGDVLVEFNGRPIRSADDVRNRIGLLRAGQTVQFTLVRGGKRRTVDVELEFVARQVVDGADLHLRLTGAAFSEIDEGSPYFGRVQGIQVESVDAQSPASGLGLRDGDLVLAVNRRRVHDLEAFTRLVSQAGRTLLLNIQRGNASVLLMVN